MSAGDIKVTKNGGGTAAMYVEDRTTSSASATIKAGEPIKMANPTDSSAHYPVVCATGEPEAGTDVFLGVAKTESTETSTVDGRVTYEKVIAMVTELRGKATTTTNMDTEAELNGLLGDQVTFDLTSSVYTIDEDEGNDPNVHALKLVRGNIVDGTLDVVVIPTALFYNA